MSSKLQEGSITLQSSRSLSSKLEIYSMPWIYHNFLAYHRWKNVIFSRLDHIFWIVLKNHFTPCLLGNLIILLALDCLLPFSIVFMLSNIFRCIKDILIYGWNLQDRARTESYRNAIFQHQNYIAGKVSRLSE